MRVCIVGMGYVGLANAACLSFLGHDVVCVDQDLARIELLKTAHLPIFESGLSELLEHGMGGSGGSAGLVFSDDLEAAVREAELVLVAVATSPQSAGEPDLHNVGAVARVVGAVSVDGKSRVLAYKSTVPIGASEWIDFQVRKGYASQCVLSTENMGADATEPRCAVVANPDFLREGRALADTLYPDRIVVGTHDPEAMAIMRTLYAPIIGQTFQPPAAAPRPEGFGVVPWVETDPQSAELIKLTSNAFLAAKISFANEIATLCEKVEADVVEVMRGIGLDNRIGPQFLDAGVGWGGDRFDKSIAALLSTAREYDYVPELLTAAVSINQQQRRRVIQKLQDRLRILKGKVIGLLGLTVKPNTDDLRGAPALEIARTLMALGARVKVYDPVAMEACRLLEGLELVYAADPSDLAHGCDALVVVTEWDEFRSLDLAALRPLMRTPLLVDARNCLSPVGAQAVGFEYVGMGRLGQVT